MAFFSPFRQLVFPMRVARESRLVFQPLMSVLLFTQLLEAIEDDFSPTGIPRVKVYSPPPLSFWIFFFPPVLAPLQAVVAFPFLQVVMEIPLYKAGVKVPLDAFPRWFPSNKSMPISFPPSSTACAHLLFLKSEGMKVFVYLPLP